MKNLNHYAIALLMEKITQHEAGTGFEIDRYLMHETLWAANEKNALKRAKANCRKELAKLGKEGYDMPMHSIICLFSWPPLV